MHMAVIPVQSAELASGSDHRARDGRDAGEVGRAARAIHARVEVEKEPEAAAAPAREMRLSLDERHHARVRVCRREFANARGVRADMREGDECITRADVEQRLEFERGRTFEAGDAAVEHELHDRAELCRFHMRAPARGVAPKLRDDGAHVGFDPRGVNEECGCAHPGERRRHYATGSITTAVP